MKQKIERLLLCKLSIYILLYLLPLLLYFMILPVHFHVRHRDWL